MCEPSSLQQPGGGPAPAPAPRHARGCFRRSRHWVGLTIVAIQMAAWCLVGALLMHRGISNLRRRERAHAHAPGPGPVQTPQVPLRADGDGPQDGGALLPSRGIAHSEEAPAPVLPPPPPQLQPPPQPQPPPEDSLLYPEPTTSPRHRQFSFFPRNSPARPMPWSANSLDVERDSKDRPNLPAGAPAPPVPQKGVASGTATAVVMVTVGGVMLVVGPAFLLVKVIDVYQRQSRMNKLSRQEDPPPSYDEVTEKAPRYSALFQVSDSGELVPLTGTGTMMAGSEAEGQQGGEVEGGALRPQAQAASHWEKVQSTMVHGQYIDPTFSGLENPGFEGLGFPDPPQVKPLVEIRFRNERRIDELNRLFDHCHLEMKKIIKRGGNSSFMRC